MARKSATVAQRRSPGKGSSTIAIVMATIVGVATLPLCVVLGAGMLPTAVAAMVDRHRRRHLTRDVAAANLAGMVWPVMLFFRFDFSLAGALHVLGDPRNWLVMYSGAGIGWILHGATPVIARIILDIRSGQAERRLRRQAELLAEEWGPDLRGG
ncbi:MAG TPA: hypothetical protein VN802_01055 [Stellaceae bacterium]|nr:hypothetical protein [Stellaceae bacterium]